MRLPRRVPWASLAELDQVCTWIYADERDWDGKVLAINRLSAWKCVTPLPHALESTLALLAVIQQDKSTPDSPHNHLSLRHSYAAAIIRLVNGLVDPLQLGAYARSIASIAAQLGLSAWLVELRHAATHEDLPSLEVLREAARQSMRWLFNNYFLPAINPTSAFRRDVPSLRPLNPVLKQYKSLMKTITRDASLRTRYKQEVNAITRDIERWIAEAKVAANIAIGDVNWDTDEDMPGKSQDRNRDGSIDDKEKWALEQFCDVLLEKGGLVPLSKKKRTFPEDKFWPPPLSVSLWTPLLNHIQMLHTDFAHTLCTRILSVLFPAVATPPSGRPNSEDGIVAEAKCDPSYHMCLARWMMWSLDTWSSTSTEDETDVRLRRNITKSLMQILGHRLSDTPSKDNKAVNALLQAIRSHNATYSAIIEFLTKSTNHFAPREWTDNDMAAMTDRLTRLLSTEAKKANLVSVPESDMMSMGASTLRDIPKVMEMDEDMPRGWQRVSTASWKSCPVGVFYNA